jgi:hypothetical protein
VVDRRVRSGRKSVWESSYERVTFALPVLSHSCAGSHGADNRLPCRTNPGRCCSSECSVRSRRGAAGRRCGSGGERQRALLALLLLDANELVRTEQLVDQTEPPPEPCRAPNKADTLARESALLSPTRQTH